MSEQSERITRGAARAVKATNRRFLVLFLSMAAVFGLLAWRTEVNADELEAQQNSMEQAFYAACLARVDRQILANQSREATVQLAVSGPTAPTDPAEKARMIQQLRDALLLPVEDCGPGPQ